MKIVIVGYGPAGASAAVTAKTLSPDIDVEIVSADRLPAYRKPGVTRAFRHRDDHGLEIDYWSPDSLTDRGIVLRQGLRVIGGDTQSHSLVATDVDGGDSPQETISYDRLILATGGEPLVPPVPGVDLNGVFTLRGLADAMRISEAAEGASTATVVGAGFSGLETAERLRNLGLEVHIVEAFRVLGRLLEPEMTDRLLARLPGDVAVHEDSPLKRLVGDSRVRAVDLGNETIDCDLVVLATGVRPSTTLARALGLEVGALGGIVVDEYMRTSSRDVYAAGDCVEMRDFLTGRPLLMPVGSTAARAGRQAASAALGKDRLYDDVLLRFQYDRIFGTEIVTVGESTAVAKSLGVEVSAHFLRDSAEFTDVALLTTPGGRLVGGQVISSRMASRVGIQLLNRVKIGSTLSEHPLPPFRHAALRSYLEHVLGPIE